MESFEGFKGGDFISIIGNFKTNHICFEVNEQRIINYIYDKMNDKKISWVPFITLSFGDSVSIVDSFISIDTLEIFLAENIFKWDYDLLY